VQAWQVKSFEHTSSIRLIGEAWRGQNPRQQKQAVETAIQNPLLE